MFSGGDEKPSFIDRLTNSLKKFVLKYKWQAGLTMTLLLLFILFEKTHPYMFLQDDNRDLGLPNYVYAYRSLMGGQLALYNFHQYLGIPFMSMGQWLVFYPFSYLSVFLSQLFFGNPDATIDIFVIMHLIAGALGIFAFIRLIGIKSYAAFLGGLLWPLNSFVFFISNSWSVIAFFAGLFPWIMYCTVRLYRKFDWKCFIGLILLQSCYTGYVQLFLYGIVFEGLTVLSFMLMDLKNEKISSCIKRCRYFIFANVLAFVVSLPQFLPMFHQMNLSENRGTTMEWGSYVALSNTLSNWWYSLLNPYPNEYKDLFSGNVSFIGTVTLVLIVVAIISMVVRKKILSYTYLFVMLAGFALLWSIGDSLVGQFFYHVPIFNRFRWMFKLMIFVNFYLIIVAAIGLHKLTEFAGRISFLKSENGRLLVKRLVAVTVIILQLGQFMYLYLAEPYKNLRTHKDPLPLEEPLVDQLKNDRILSIGKDTPYAATLIGFNYATLFGLYQFGGYEPMVPDANFNATLGLQHISVYKYVENGLPPKYEWFREWGVKYYIVQDDPANSPVLKLPLAGTGYKRKIYVDNSAKPMFFKKSDNSSDGIKSDIGTNSIDLNVTLSKNDQICILFLYNEQLKATVDGNETKINRDNYGRMLINVPEGKHDVTIKYSDPYMMQGFLIMTLVLSAAGIIYLLYRSRKRKHV